MSDLFPGCAVAPLDKCNSATLPLECATEKATSKATKDLIALATQVLLQNQCNQKGNSSATEQLQTYATGVTSQVDKTSKKSCTVAIPKRGNYATAIKTVKCNDCDYYLPDNLGDASGIGTCRQGAWFTREIKGRLPLYRYAERHCKLFRVSQK